jgi:hypothetical protein
MWRAASSRNTLSLGILDRECQDLPRNFKFRSSFLVSWSGEVVGGSLLRSVESANVGHVDLGYLGSGTMLD